MSDPASKDRVKKNKGGREQRRKMSEVEIQLPCVHALTYMCHIHILQTKHTTLVQAGYGGSYL